MGVAGSRVRITSERLVLESPRRRHLGPMEAVFDDVVLTAQGWTDDTRTAWLHYLRWASVHRRKQEILVLVISDRSAGEVLGTVSVDLRHRIPPLGLILGPTARGRGIGLEAVSAALPRLAALGHRTLAIETAEENTAMRTIAERAGFTLSEGYAHSLPDGRRVPAVRYLRSVSEGSTSPSAP